MNHLVWEYELMPTYGGTTTEWNQVLHLKVAWKSPDGRVDQHYKISVAWITRPENRKWILSFADTYPPKMFKTLKAAKAYAVAIVTLES